MSLKSNFIYSSILTVSKYVFPLIVYPYVSRTLGLSNIGIVNFIDNLINYFALISMMGIATVGVREIAAARSDKRQLSQTFISLLTLTAITTVIAIIALWIAMYTVSDLIPYQDLLYVGIIKLIFNLFLMEWFFMGIEDFRYITNRSIFVKCLYVICIFLFVRTASDYKLYYLISATTVIANALFNLVYIRKFINWSFHSINIRPYYQAFLIMGVYVLLTNFYTMLNPVWLGFVTNTDEVGYFTTATKLHNIIMAFLLSFTNILFPRVSNLLAEGNKEEFWQKINTAFDAIFLFAFPTICFMLVAGPDLLLLVVGAAAIAVGANFLVEHGTVIAAALGVPDSVIGLTMVALGTSLPELITAITSLIKGHSSLSVGNIIGANLFNIVLVSGMAITIHPFTIPAEKLLRGHNASLVVDMPVMWIVCILLCLPSMIKGKVSRWQGITLLVIYTAFTVFQFLG